ncbi:MAG: M48 family metalloprotease, partial [Rhizobiales bacterium]|nr:M48 family metalloprotease [Rhizobacter sp.]
MKTLSSKPEMRRLLRRCVALVMAFVMAVPAFAQNQLPALGDPSGEDFSVATENKLGEAIMGEIRADPDYLDDPVLLEYLQSLWQPLVVQARSRGNISADIDQRLAWEPFLVRDKEVNAFALPGGYVGINLGLIAITATRDELASVLAHEMSHVTQRHIARSIGNAKRQSLLSLAAMLAGLVVASQAGNSSVDAAQAAVVGSQALAAQGQLNFSRDMEREADRVGWQIMTGAGYTPAGMASMFEKMEQSSRLNDFGGYPYLRSHPLTSERIGEARSRMGANAAITGGQALAAQGQLNFSRDMEREADRVGIGAMQGAGYAAGGMAAMFEKLDQTSRLNDSGGFPYLRSHPLTSERIGEARSRLGPGAMTSALKA